MNRISQTRDRSRVGYCAHLTLIPLSVLLLAVAPGCDNTEKTDSQEKFSVVEAEPLHRKSWLESQDTTAPELWLASRAEHTDVSESQPAVIDIRQRLATAHERFGETSRMIANRAVQLEGMLLAEGISESALELLNSLTAVSGGIGTNGGFGAVCQQYFNLRKSGKSQQAALDALRASHGSRT